MNVIAVATMKLPAAVVHQELGLGLAVPVVLEPVLVPEPVLVLVLVLVESVP